MVKNPVRSVIAAIHAAALRWSDRHFAPRIETRDAVSARTGYSLAAVEYALDRLFGALRREAIEAIIADELGSVDVLDGFAARPARPQASARASSPSCATSTARSYRGGR